MPFSIILRRKILSGANVVGGGFGDGGSGGVSGIININCTPNLTQFRFH